MAEKAQQEIWNEMRRFDRAKTLEVAHWTAYLSHNEARLLAEAFTRWGDFSNSIPPI